MSSSIGSFLRRAAGAAAIALAFLAAMPHNAMALDPSEFRYSVSLNSKLMKDSIYQVKLGPQIVERAAAGFSDLRVVSHDTSEVPYVVLDNITPAEFVSNYYVLEYLPKPPEEDTASVTYELRMPKNRRPVTVFEFDTQNQDFKKNVTISGSADGASWATVAEDFIFDFSSQADLRKTQIKLSGSIDHEYYRIKISDSDAAPGAQSKSIQLKYEGLDFNVSGIKTQKLKLDRVAAKTGTNVARDRTVAYDEKIFAAPPMKKDKDGNSVIDIEANLPANRITFAIGTTYYNRRVTVLTSETGEENSYSRLTETALYNFPMAEFRSYRYDIHLDAPKHRFYRFVIENKNNPPLAVNSITFEWVQKLLYFIALSDSPGYAVCFGNGAFKRPEYDIAGLISQSNWYKQKFTALDAAPVVENAGFKPAVPKAEMKPEVEKAILTALVVLVVAGLGFWLYSLMSKMAPPPQAGGDQD